MNNIAGSAEPKRSVTAFFVLTIVLSVPIWILSAITAQALPLPEETPLNPLGLVVTFAPLASALILTFRDGRSGSTKEILKRSFDYKRITRKIWYLPILVAWPVIFGLGYGLLILLEVPLPVPDIQIPVVVAPILFVVFFILALGEEVGWQGYAYDPMEYRWNALQASIVLGLIWALWHIPSYAASAADPVFIAGQFAFLLLARILIVWIFNNTGKSVFAAILFHTVYNVCTLLFPNYTSPLGLIVTGVVALFGAIVVTYLWGANTLAQYRFSKKEQGIIG